jgi:SAM-dependent methyltransferase
MDARQRQRIISAQRDALLRYGHHPNALYWGSREVQEQRFQVLSEMSGIEAGESLLDVGCGFGDLAAWLEQQGIPVDYTGIDLSPDLLEEGRRQDPDIRLIEADLFDFNPPPESYDWVWLSGTLNRDLEDDGQYVLAVITRMFDACRKGIAFNLLDARDEWTGKRWDLQCFRPSKIEVLVAGLSDCHDIRDDYLKGDFSVLVMKPSP